MVTALKVLDKFWPADSHDQALKKQQKNRRHRINGLTLLTEDKQ